MVQTHTFRLFVSSTFTDLKAERDALQTRVFPRLRELCAEHGVRFQAIDLRWGVSEEASLDQQTMNICLNEIARCQEITPRPNFLVLLGDRYGWCPPPPEIPAIEFETILDHATEDERAQLLEWYRKDKNAVPNAYLLLPRQPDSAYSEYSAWEPIEASLQATLSTASKNLNLNAQRSLIYNASATHQEIAAGAMRVQDADEHVFCFFREIEGLPERADAADFLDTDEHGDIDQEAQKKLESLKNQLRRLLPENVFTYSAAWQDDGLSLDHIEPLCEDVYAALSRLILEEINQFTQRDELVDELTNHQVFAQERTQSFVGRASPLAQISHYLKDLNRQPLALWGVSGSGKSSVIAKAIEHAQGAFPQAEIIYRFIGVTPDSTDIRLLLESLCMQISRSYSDESHIFSMEFRDLVQEFSERLSLANAERPLIIFLDALDQLSNTNNAHHLRWLPAKLPQHVFLIVSTIPSDCYNALKARLPPANFIELETMPEQEAEILLDLWLNSAKRTLQPEQREEILTKFKGCPLPLYLELAFEEVRRWKSYEAVPTNLEGLAGLRGDIWGLLRDFFGRLASQANHGPKLVARSLGYLAASKNGLAEDEMMDLLAQDLEVYLWFIKHLHHTPPDLLSCAQEYLRGHPQVGSMENAESALNREATEKWLAEVREEETDSLRDFLGHLWSEGVRLRLPVVLWSRLYADLEPYLSWRAADGSRLLGFYHRQVGEVVQEDYLEADAKRELHKSLAAYYQSQSILLTQEGTSAQNLRKLSELPFQLTYAGLWDELRSTLTTFDFLQAKVEAFDPQVLITDYARASEEGLEDSLLSIIRNTLQLAANYLKEDSTLLAGQLLGRLLAHSEPKIHSLLEQAREWEGAPWLCPLRQNLSPPGQSLLRTFGGHKGSVTVVVTLPDNQRFISASEDHTLRLWDGETGEELFLLEGHQGPVWAAAVSSDGRLAITGADDQNLLVWDLEAWKVLRRLEGHKGPIRAVAFTPSGRHALSGSDDHTIILWDLEVGKVIRTMEGHTGRVNAIAVFADDRRAVSASEDCSLHVWDLSSGEVIYVIKGHTSPVRTVDIHPDDKHILSGAWDPIQIQRNIKFWEVDSGKEMTLRDRVWGVNAVKILPDGVHALAAIADGTIKILNLERGVVLSTLEGHSDEVTDLATFSANAQRIISASKDRSIKLWMREQSVDMEGLFDSKLPMAHQQVQQQRYFNRPKQSGVHARSLDAVAMFPKRKRAIAAVNIKAVGTSESGIITQLSLWNLPTGVRIRSIDIRAGDVHSVAVFSGGSRALTASNADSLQVWNLKSGQSSASPRLHDAWIADAKLFNDSERVITASADKTLGVFEVSTWNPTVTLEGHEEGVNAVAIFPDERRVISASDDNTLRIWDLNSAQEVQILQGHNGPVQDVVVLPDGKRAISSSQDNNLLLWDVDTGDVLKILQDHAASVEAVALFASGKCAISASSDHTLKVWDLDEGQLIATFVGEGPYRCCAAPLEGLSMIAGGALGQVNILKLVGYPG